MEISIIMMTYNHEQYVCQALESILMQKLTVSHELLIVDDGSTDKTQDIICAYKKRFLCPVRTCLKKNNWNWPTKNAYYIFSKARGRYIAVIEGDDYWTDEYKLQKQYDFLEKHKNYSACVTDYYVVNQESQRIDGSSNLWKIKYNNSYTMEDFKHMVYPGMTVTFFARNYFDADLYKIFYQASNMSGDITWIMLLLMKGNIYQSKEVTSAYRYVQKEGGLNYNSINKNNRYKDYNVAQTWIRQEKFMRKNYNGDFKIFPIDDLVLQLYSQLPKGALLKLILESSRKSELLRLIVANKILGIDSWVYEKSDNKCEITMKNNWLRFWLNRKRIIIFGVGSMAGDYLDKYAWLKDILFLVDNNVDKQGTSYKGYIVKSPKEIQQYRGKASVLICNLEHEIEIEKQLKSMGITEYYCYCSMIKNSLRAKLAYKIYEKRNKNI